MVIIFLIAFAVVVIFLVLILDKRGDPKALEQYYKIHKDDSSYKNDKSNHK